MISIGSHGFYPNIPSALVTHGFWSSPILSSDPVVVSATSNTSDTRLEIRRALVQDSMPSTVRIRSVRQSEIALPPTIKRATEV